MSAADQLNYVFAAYTLVIGGTAGVTLWSWLAMHRAERDNAR